ncbi:MAG: hypothetical protein HYZ92_06505 [Candidatus Omnitrophica bacterium]|nr:hypothetical protein [Candidatus Omnitrophota bacterium]
MSANRFSSWLSDWLRRHPLKSPSASVHQGYVGEVMARIRSLAPSASATPQPLWVRQLRQWFSSPALAGGLAAVALIVSVGLWLRAVRNPARLARAIETAAGTLEEVQDDDQAGLTEELAPSAQDELAGPLRQVDAMVLAEATGDSEREWIDRTFELLDQVEESERDSEDSGQWLDELRRLDDAELRGSS